MASRLSFLIRTPAFFRNHRRCSHCAVKAIPIKVTVQAKTARACLIHKLKFCSCGYEFSYYLVESLYWVFNSSVDPDFSYVASICDRKRDWMLVNIQADKLNFLFLIHVTLRVNRIIVTWCYNLFYHRWENCLLSDIISDMFVKLHRTVNLKAGSKVYLHY